jgi:hypothetical protein
MLGFRWFFDEAGAPDDRRYAGAVDRLNDIDGNELQRFGKTGSDFVAPGATLRRHVDRWLLGGTRNRVFVLVHGFDFDVEQFKTRPDNPDDPFNGIYARPAPGQPPKPECWLPIAGEVAYSGEVWTDCTVGFGWDSDCSYFGVRGGFVNGYQYAALEVAPLAARALASILAALANKGVPISILAHSLGTRVTCQALRILAAADRPDIVERVALLNGAEYSVDACDAVDSNRRTHFFNLGNQEDGLPRFGAEASHPFRYAGTPARRVIGHDGIADLANLADLQIDRDGVAQWALEQGYELKASPATVGRRQRGVHWAGYIHPGNRRFLTDLLVDAARTPAWFRATAAPLGFERPDYGALAGVRIPLVPRTSAARHAMIRGNKEPTEFA